MKASFQYADPPVIKRAPVCERVDAAGSGSVDVEKLERHIFGHQDILREGANPPGIPVFGETHARPVWLTTCRSAANAKVAFERNTAATSRGRSPRRRGKSSRWSVRVWRSSAATAC
jgi:hypothetical protein